MNLLICVKLKTEKRHIGIGTVLAERPMWCHYIFMSVCSLQASGHMKELTN